MYVYMYNFCLGPSLEVQNKKVLYTIIHYNTTLVTTYTWYVVRVCTHIVLVCFTSVPVYMSPTYFLDVSPAPFSCFNLLFI